MCQETEFVCKESLCIFEFSFYIESIKVSICDENSTNCNYFSLVIDVEPSFTSNVENLPELESYDIGNINDLDSDMEDEAKTQFFTEWYKINEHPSEKTFDIFFSDVHGNIKECLVNQKITCSGKLPNWTVNLAKRFYCFPNSFKNFQSFLLSVLQIRITIWASKYKETNSTNIWEIGETIIQVCENQQFSQNSFFFIHKIPDHDAISIKNNLYFTNECTIGVLKAFFNTFPVITLDCKGVSSKKKNFSLNNQTQEIETFNTSIMKKNEMYINDYLPLQWEYLDDENITRGPFNSIVMMSWIIKGYFSNDSKLRLYSQLECADHTNKSCEHLKSDFHKLSECILFIKSDISRMFLNSFNYETKQKELMNNLKNSDKGLNQLENFSYIFENKNYLKMADDSNITNSDSKIPTNYKTYLQKKKIGKAMDSLKQEFSKIETEFNRKMSSKTKVKNNLKSQINCCNLSKDEVICRNKVIEDATRNVFLQKRNLQFKKWCAEYGPELVLEACAIRIQTAYRKYISKKKK